MLLLNVSDDLENSHPMNIMHFGPEDNKQAYDFFGNESKLLPTEQIMATVLFYLSNVSQGGQILFPESDVSKQLCISCYLPKPAVNDYLCFSGFTVVKFSCEELDLVRLY